MPSDLERLRSVQTRLQAMLEHTVANMELTPAKEGEFTGLLTQLKALAFVTSEVRDAIRSADVLAARRTQLVSGAADASLDMPGELPRHVERLDAELVVAELRRQALLAQLELLTADMERPS